MKTNSLNIKAIFSLLIISVFWGMSSCSQPKYELDTKKLEELFEPLNELPMAFGTIAITQDNQLKYQKGLGYRSMSDKTAIPSSHDTSYRIGSVTKMFTSILIFQLIEEKKLSLSESLDTYFPQLPNAKKISIKNLLGHSSGLPDYTNSSDFPEWKFTHKPKDEIIGIIINQESQFAPSSRREYCNTNYLLLSYIAEIVGGQSYQAQIKDQIIDKVGLTNTYFEDSNHAETRNSISYKYGNGQWVQQKDDFAGNHQGAGALVSTPVDLVKFINAVFNHELISSKSLDKITQTVQEYGLGIFKFDIENTISYGHEGRINEYYTSLLYLPKQKIAIAYCTNGILYPRDDIVKKTIEICIGKTFAIPYYNGLLPHSNEIDKIIGDYKGKFIPIEVKCKKNKDELVVNTQGIDFNAKKIEENYFMNLDAGYFFEFFPYKNQLLIKETDNVYLLEKE